MFIGSSFPSRLRVNAVRLPSLSLPTRSVSFAEYIRDWNVVLIEPVQHHDKPSHPFFGSGCCRFQLAQPRADPRPLYRRRFPAGRILLVIGLGVAITAVASLVFHLAFGN